VGDELLYVEDVKGALALRIYQHELDIYSLLEAEARRRIDEKLLADAARARGISREALEAELVADVPEVGDEEIRLYLEKNPPSGRVDPERARERVRLYLAETRRLEARIAFLESLREAAGVEILLPRPVPPRTEIDLSGAPSRGPADAPVVIVHFASFGSRSSAKSAARLERLWREFPERIRWVHRNLLQDRDELGLHAARIAIAAAEIGRFWPLHDALFDRDGALTTADVDALALESGVPPERIAAAARDPRLVVRVKEDIDLANASGVPREPGLFVNGLFVSGLAPYDELREIVRRELAADPEPRS
jgi:protein-disulfide isomerase